VKRELSLGLGERLAADMASGEDEQRGAGIQFEAQNAERRSEGSAAGALDFLNHAAFEVRLSLRPKRACTLACCAANMTRGSKSATGSKLATAHQPRRASHSARVTAHESQCWGRRTRTAGGPAHARRRTQAGLVPARAGDAEDEDGGSDAEAGPFSADSSSRAEFVSEDVVEAAPRPPPSPLVPAGSALFY